MLQQGFRPSIWAVARLLLLGTPFNLQLVRFGFDLWKYLWNSGLQGFRAVKALNWSFYSRLYSSPICQKCKQKLPNRSQSSSTVHLSRKPLFHLLGLLLLLWCFCFGFVFCLAFQDWAMRVIILHLAFASHSPARTSSCFDIGLSILATTNPLRQRQ